MPDPNDCMQEELERIVLGTILSNPVLAVGQELKPEYFTDIRNQVICEIILRVTERRSLGQSVAQILEQKGIPEGMSYLERLKNYAVQEDLFPDLVAILKEEYYKHLRPFPL